MDEFAPSTIEERDDISIACSGDDASPVTVSVVIPSYRAEATLRRAALSALDQTMRDLELIIVDDASDDGTWKLVLELQRKDGRVRAIRHRQNLGKPIAMNRAIGCARGHWIAVLDADDWYDPRRLAALIAIGEAQHVDLVADNQFLFDVRANRIVGTAWTPAATHWLLGFDAFLAGADAYRSFNLGMLKPVLRRDFIQRSGLAYAEAARNGQDFFYLLEFYLRGGRAAITSNSYYYYSQPFGRASRQWSHAGRHRYDFATACRINEAYAATAAAVLTSRQTRRLRRRSRQLRALECFFRTRERIAAGNPLGAAFGLARCPAVVGYVVRRLNARCLGRAGSRVIDRIAARARRTRSSDRVPVAFVPRAQS